MLPKISSAWPSGVSLLALTQLILGPSACIAEQAPYIVLPLPLMSYGQTMAIFVTKFGNSAGLTLPPVLRMTRATS